MRPLTPSFIVDFFSDRLCLNSFRGTLTNRVLNKKVKKCVDPMDYVNVCFDSFTRFPLKYVGWPITPRQDRQEIKELLSLLAQRDINIMLEIGTAEGGTLFLFTRIASSKAKIISLDLPIAPFGGGYQNLPSARTPLFSNFAQKGQRIFLVRANSHSNSSMSTIKSILKDQKLDFLFIDGDHTYEGVKLDFQMYRQLVKENGVIAFHDIVSGPPNNVGGVPKFWNKTKHNFEYVEIVNNWNKKWGGIGVLYT